MLDLKKYPSSIRREVRKIQRGGIELALHVWLPQDVKAAIFYFHGLQSHGGWLWEVGPQFAGNDVAVFVLDREGCGISGGTRNEIAAVKSSIDDYIAAISLVRELIGNDIPLSLFGHCLGGSYLAALMHDPLFDIRYDSAIFCSAWLGKLHTTLTENDRHLLNSESRTDWWDVGLHASDFTDSKRYQEFINLDDLAVRQIPLCSRKILLEMENNYLASSRTLPTVPMAYVSGKTDPIIDLDAAHNAFMKFTSGQGTVLTLPTDKHYLFFTDVRISLVDWASAFILLNARETYA